MTLKIYNLSSALGQAQAYGGFKSMWSILSCFICPI